MERDRVNNSEEYKIDHHFTLDVLGNLPDTAKLFMAKLPKDIIVIAFYEVFGSNGLTVAFCDSKGKLEKLFQIKDENRSAKFLVFLFSLTEARYLLLTYVVRNL